MSEALHRRRFIQVAGGMASLLATPPFLRAAEGQAGPGPVFVERSNIDEALRKRIEEQAGAYMVAHAAPGMQFALTDLHGHESIAAFGYENLTARTPLKTNRLFQIGSISKSMAAIAALQLVEEGRLDLHRPVVEYLPWLAWKTPFGPVSLHHILTHSSGMPGGGALFFPGQTWVHNQAYAPGKNYFYSNMAYNVVGRLVAMCDGRSYQQSLVERIFRPVGMSASRSALGGEEWDKQATSYVPAAIDKPYRRFDALREAPPFHEDTSAGCVASTPSDMAKYLRCLLRGGVTDSGKRILQEESFRGMTSHWIDAKEWGPHAGYGYGLGVDTVDGSRVLLHTGGMVSFMSAIYLDLTHGVAAFASINAQQGYRPMPVARFATEAFVAAKHGTSSPAPIRVPTEKESNAAEPAPAEHYPQYVGTYVNDDPWDGALTVRELQGILRLDGTLLEPAGNGSFYLRSEPDAPDRVAFDCILQGVAEVLLLNGTEYRRFRSSSNR